MKHFPITPRILATGAILGLALAVTGCSDNDDLLVGPSSSQDLQFEVTVTNLTAAQPLSPVAVLLHEDNWRSFATGASASTDLEYLAEGGDNSFLLASANSDDDVHANESGGAIIAPGGSETINIRAERSDLDTLSITVLSMLVNTNDAIVALNGSTLSDFSTGQRRHYDLLSYDTGTEANTESDDSIPGPAASGAREGFNATRDDVNALVHVHPGVVTADDGLATSTLDASHRWDHPAVRVTVERTR